MYNEKTFAVVACGPAWLICMAALELFPTNVSKPIVLLSGTSTTSLCVQLVKAATAIPSIHKFFFIIVCVIVVGFLRNKCEKIVKLPVEGRFLPV